MLGNLLSMSPPVRDSHSLYPELTDPKTCSHQCTSHGRGSRAAQRSAGEEREFLNKTGNDNNGWSLGQTTSRLLQLILDPVIL